MVLLTTDAVKTAVVLFSHGSLLCGSGEALMRHAASLRSMGRFVAVEIGYLNYNDPPVEIAVQRCREAGAERIVIIPYFLVPGKFVKSDLPPRIESIRVEHSQLDIRLARAIEDSPAMLTVVRAQLEIRSEPRSWQLLAVERAREQCELRETCPIYGSDLCRAEGDSALDSMSGKWQRPLVSLEQLNDRPASKPPISPAEKRGLIMILHGSPRPEANAPAVAIADQIRLLQKWDYVSVAYLECNEPSVTEALDRAGSAGVTRLDVLPYFLHFGRHLVVDIGNELQRAQQRWPMMDIGISPAVGESPQLAEVLVQRAEEILQQGSGGS